MRAFNYSQIVTCLYIKQSVCAFCNEVSSILRLIVDGYNVRFHREISIRILIVGAGLNNGYYV